MLTDEAKKRIAPLINEEILEDIYIIVDMYCKDGLEGIFPVIEKVIEKVMGDEKIVKAGEDGMLVLVAIRTSSFEEFKKAVML